MTELNGTIKVVEHRDLAVPDKVRKALDREGGYNRYGEPRYRFVYGYKRWDWKLTMPGPEMREALRYERKPNRFYLEYWMPPESYGDPVKWFEDGYQRLETGYAQLRGPFPFRGDYEHLWTCETVDEQFLWPTEEIAIAAVRRHRRVLAQTSTEIRDGIAEDEAAANSMKDVDDMLDQAAKDFVKQAIKGRTVRELKEDLTHPGKRQIAA